MEANSCSSMEGSLYSTLWYFIYHRGIQEDTWAADRRHHTVCPSLVHVCRYRPWRHHLKRSQNVRPRRQRLHSQRWVRKYCVAPRWNVDWWMLRHLNLKKCPLLSPKSPNFVETNGSIVAQIYFLNLLQCSAWVNTDTHLWETENLKHGEMQRRY